MNEVLEIAQKLGIDLSINDILDQREVLKKINPNARYHYFKILKQEEKQKLKCFLEQ